MHPAPEGGVTVSTRFGALDRRAVRFVLVGIVNTLFSFGVFAALQSTIGLHVHYLVVLVISHVVGVLEAYVLQRWLVFQVSGRWWRELAKFWSVYLVALGANAVALPVLVELAGVPVLPAQAIVMLGTALGTFVAHRAFTFRRSDATPT
jgi:putative flippase GtrA